MQNVAMRSQNVCSYTIVCDERCAVVKRLSALVKWWDRGHAFTFVDRDSASPAARRLVSDLDQSRWSLMLVDEHSDRWHGPEAVPIILMNLPFGKLAAVLYILPGTMWLTRQLYMFVSRNRRLLRAAPPPPQSA